MKPGALTGETIAGRYQLQQLLGQGGMGAVYVARDLDMEGRPVALKVVLPNDPDGRLLARMMREARLASRLRHPHVIEVFDHGRWGPDQAHFYLVMALNDGVSLAAVARAGVSVEVACGLVAQMLEALAYVHARGVLHRDVKPDNVLVARDAATGRLEVRLADFGLAAALDVGGPGATQLTREGTILGTPAYMAPEQAIADIPLGPACDLYAVGVVLFELLSGALPFTGTVTQLLLAKCSQLAPAVTGRGKPLPEGLVQVVARMLAPTPAERFSLGADALDALRPWTGPAVVETAWWEALRGREGSAPAAEPLVPARHPTQQSVFFGRDQELATLGKVVVASEAGDGQVVLITGAVGVGKSALAEHLLEPLNQLGRFVLLRTRTPPGSDVLIGLRGALDRWLGTSGQRGEIVRRAMQARLGPMHDEDLDEALALLRPSPGQAPDVREGTAIFVRLLRRLASSRAVAVLIDGLEPDAATAAFVELLLFELSIEPMSCLWVLPLPAWAAGGPMVQMLGRTARAEGQNRCLLELGPMVIEVMASMIERRHGLAPREAERLARRAGGNPLFLDFLLAAMGGEATAEQVTSSSVDVAVPETLRAVVATGLAEALRLTPDERRATALLEDVAVLGGQVEIRLLEAVVAAERRPWFEDDLDALIEQRVLDDAGADAVVFRQSIVREVVLAGISERRLRRMHARAAEVRQQQGATSVEGSGALGEHLAASGQTGAAAEAWVVAFEGAQALGRPSEIAKWGARALSVLAPSDGRRAGIALATGKALRADAELDAAVAVLSPLLEAASADIALGAMEVICEVHQERLRVREQRELVEALAHRVEEAGPAGKAAWYRAQAFCLNMASDWSGGRAAALEALRWGEAPSEQIVAGVRLCLACQGAGAHDEAWEHVLDVLSRADVAACRADALALRAAALATRVGDADELVRVLTQQIEEHRRAGSLGRVIVAQVNLGAALWCAGQVEAGARLCEEARELALRFGLWMEVARASTITVFADVYRGEVERAETRSHALQTVVGSRVSPVGRLVWGVIHAAQGRPHEAREVLAPLTLEVLPGVRLFTIAGDFLLEALMGQQPGLLERRLNHEVLIRARRSGDVEIVARCEARAARLPSAG